MSRNHLVDTLGVLGAIVVLVGVFFAAQDALGSAPVEFDTAGTTSVLVPGR